MKKSRTIHTHPKRPLLVHHSHTGRVLHRHHTSYPLIAFMILLVGILLSGLTLSVFAGPSVSGNVNVQASVSGNPPTVAAVITSPINGSTTQIVPQVVTGTCQVQGYLIKLYRNAFFSGAAICDSSKKFSIVTDLFPGNNRLVARTFNQANEEGPESSPVTTTYAVATSLSPTAAQQAQLTNPLVFHADATYAGYVAGENISWLLELVGGSPPYAVTVDWGDGKTDVISRPNEGSFEISHTYSEPGKVNGSYVIRLRSVDSVGNATFLQLVAIVNVDGSISQAIKNEAAASGQGSSLAFAWPSLMVVSLVALSFWLGEKRAADAIRSHAGSANKLHSGHA